MGNSSCVEFLKWALPRLGLAWSGFRRVHRQVCKRIGRRVRELHLADSAAYRGYLESNPAEWETLHSFCRISISRFYRDQAVFDCLGREVLPSIAESAIAREAAQLRCWSAGCAAGEEPYTLNILWGLALAPRFPSVSLRIVATDADEHQLERARAGCYRSSSLNEIPPAWRSTAFDRSGPLYWIRSKFRQGIELQQQDIRAQAPADLFDLILCRNLVFTYFDRNLQRTLLRRFLARLRPGGGLVIGMRERLPEEVAGIMPWFPAPGIYRKLD